MHAPQFSDADLNLFARALDTLAEQALELKNRTVAQVQAAQIEAQKKADAPKKPAGKKKS